MIDRNELDKLMLQLVNRENKSISKNWFYNISENLVHDTDGRDCDWHCCLCNKDFINSHEYEYPNPTPDVIDDQIDQHAIKHLKEYGLLAFF
jgi:hypothetical protein